MLLFTPPARKQGSSHHFWGRYQINVGVSVVKVGGSFVEFPFPQPSDLVGLVDGVDFFRGGYDYTISDVLAAELVADGFTDSRSLDGSYGFGGYGGGLYGGYL